MSDTSIPVRPSPEADTTPATTPPFWASVASSGDRFDSSAARWRVWIHPRRSRAVVDTFDLSNPGTEIHLEDIDLALAARRWFRATSWEMGSDYGWVARLESERADER